MAGQHALRRAIAADEEARVQRSARRLVGGLVAQVEAQPHVGVGPVLERAVDHALVEEQDRPGLDLERQRIAPEALVGDDVAKIARTVWQQAPDVGAGEHDDRAVLEGRVGEGRPHRQDVGLVRLFEQRRVVLVPPDAREVSFSSDRQRLEREFDPKVLGRVAHDLRPDDLLDEDPGVGRRR